MLVRELIEKLSEMDGEMEVCFADLYARIEYWDETCNGAVCPIDSISVHDNMVIFETEILGIVTDYDA